MKLYAKLPGGLEIKIERAPMSETVKETIIMALAMIGPVGLLFLAK